MKSTWALLWRYCTIFILGAGITSKTVVTNNSTANAMTFSFPWQKFELLHTTLVSQRLYTVSIFQDCEMFRDKQATKCHTREGLFMTYMNIKSD